MQDLTHRIEKLLADAADCDLIGNLAADMRTRAIFRRVAEQLREVAQELNVQVGEGELSRHQQPTRAAADSSS